MSDPRPLVWCSTCRDEHAEGAPHFAYANRAMSDPSVQACPETTENGAAMCCAPLGHDGPHWAYAL